MSRLEELLERHVQSMRRIDALDRECATNLSVLHSSMIWSTGAYHTFMKGNTALAKLMDDKSRDLMEVLSGGQGLTAAASGGSGPGGGTVDLQSVGNAEAGVGANPEADRDNEDPARDPAAD